MQRITLLYLDDSRDEHLLLRWAARFAPSCLNLRHFTHLEPVKAYLAGRRPYTNRDLHPTPALALLDYDLGGQTSLGLLNWIRARPVFNNIPLVIFTGNSSPGCIQSCYAAGADFFLEKPTSFDRRQAILLAIWNCLSLRPLSFNPLTAVPEYRAGPGLSRPSAFRGGYLRRRAKD